MVLCSSNPSQSKPKTSKTFCKRFYLHIQSTRSTHCAFPKFSPSRHAKSSRMTGPMKGRGSIHTSSGDRRELSWVGSVRVPHKWDHLPVDCHLPNITLNGWKPGPQQILDIRVNGGIFFYRLVSDHSEPDGSDQTTCLKELVFHRLSDM